MNKYSIIIPTYNSEASLPTCLESIARQEYDGVEILIMDGLSQDATIDIANSYKRTLPGLVILSEKDRGIYDAMNKGMEMASGEWILFLGSDDTLYDSSVLLDVDNKINSTNTNVLYGNAKIIGDTGWAKDGEIYAGKFTTSKLLQTNICHQAIFYNRKFITTHVGAFNLKYTINADWDFNLRCWAKDSFDYIGLTIAIFAAGGVSSNSTDSAMTNDFVANVCTYFKISPFHPLLNNPTFTFYKSVIAMQKKRYSLRFAALRYKKQILLKLKSYFGVN